ncbi:hypothetical protein Esi_0076_0080 [Ectocarpus siliculosus]|uniref:Uncharacterized protein n=1 Tax=Ectocarpus siliculosus TaxID=2880 RepID=D8LSS4_ECTSI|nr:hypothetical protein Esi_0076_0080 [Ectocarpus siliculosus]|eukprot:CBN75274.1 hypothetical protein Esi_0076_0080 [Ectocarpus siliculosus]
MGAVVENGCPAGSSSNLGAAGCAVLGQAKARRVLTSAAGARRGGRVHSSAHETVLHNAIEKNAEETLRDLSERRQHADMARRARLAHMVARRDAFGHLAECRLAQARAQSLAKTRRLLLQSADSTRRLQELLHECVGEYEKARLRGARRRRLSAEACDSVLAGKILDLRWFRFCSRLEEDSLGLIVARDLGNPTAITTAAGDPPQPTSVAARGGDAAAAAAATKVASLVTPLLASRGFGDARVLRVVALSPCHGGGGGGGPGSTSADSHRRRSRGFGPGTVDDNGGGRALSHGGQRRGDGRVAGGGGGGGGGDVVRALREAAVQSKKAGGENVSASAAAVLAVPAGTSPPAVADVVRRAVLCANGGLATALLPCKDDDDDAAVSESRSHGSSGGDRVAFRSIPGGPRRWSAVVGPPDAAAVGKGSPASSTTTERDEGSPPPQSAVGGGDAACDGAGGGHADRKGGGGQEKYMEGAGNAGSGNDRTAASVFAKSVSAMLAETYLRPKPPSSGGNAGVSRVLEREEGSTQSDRLVTPKHVGGEGLLRANQATASAEEKETVAGVRGGDEQLGGSFWGAFVGGGEGGCASAPSFVVSGTVDDHRKRGRLKAAPDGGSADDDRRLEALASVPDVLVAGPGAERPIGDHDNRRIGDHSSRETLASGGERGGLSGSGSSPVPPAAGASTANAAAATATPPTPPRRRQLHFAPAGVRQLLGTAHCREFVKALPPPARARVLALTQAFPDGTLPPIGHLYVPLAPARPGKDTLTAGSGPPLLGALVQPLPARAVRELLQIYVATTRAVGEAEGGSGGGGVRRRRRCRRTSGLLAAAPPPPPPTPLTARDRGVVRSGCEDDAGTDDGGHTESRRWSSGGQPGREEGSPGEGGGCSGAGGGDRANLAATPPSAVDVLPDEPPTSSSAPPVGIGRTGTRPAAPSCPGDGVEGADGGPTSSGGEVPADNVEDDAEAAWSARRRRTPLCSTADSGADAPISSSLRAPFRHTYVAVLAPPLAQPPSPFSSAAGSGGSGGGNGQSATTNKARAGGGGRGQTPLSGASALILQLETPVTATGSSLSSFGAVQDRGQCGAAAAVAGCGNGDGAVVVGGTGGARGGGGGAGSEMPRRVCGWRACLADAVAGPLCPVHLELKRFLDGKAAKTGGVSDAFRFLPPGSGPKRRSSLRKRRAAAAAAAAPAATEAGTARVVAALSAVDGGGEGELSVMRSMSPLLAELLNGKLGTTIAMFCRRAAAEARAPGRRGPVLRAAQNFLRGSGGAPETVQGGMTQKGSAKFRCR